MKGNSRGKSAPGTEEIKANGMVSFVKTYFKKLQEMIFGPTKGKGKKAPKAKKAAKAVKPIKRKQAGKV
jgi:hypothetical protein